MITLATIAICTEGTNVKRWDTLVLCSSIANEKDLIQILGRVRRKYDGKTRCIVIDYTFPT